MVRSLPFAFALLTALMTCGISYAEEDDDAISSSRVQQGFESSPVPKAKLNLAGKNPAKVGLGSYLVNVGGCSDCHSFPRFLEKGNTAGSNPAAGDPYEGTPSTQSVSRQLVANYNVSHFLAGGRCFGPFYARDLTPDANGQPEGLPKQSSLR